MTHPRDGNDDSRTGSNIVPPMTREEMVQRTQAYLDAGKRTSRLSLAGTAVVSAIVVLMLIAAIAYGWPVWTRAALIVMLLAIGKASMVMSSRRQQAEIAKLGLRCPHCNASLGVAKGRWGFTSEELRAMASGNCPSCFALLDNSPQAGSGKREAGSGKR